MGINARNVAISLVISLIVAFGLAAFQVNALVLIVLAALAGALTARLLPPTK
jgi:hypothetical protein